MKTIVTVIAVLALAQMAGAAEGLVAKSASGTSSATVYFSGGPREARVVSLDVTSDAAASTAKWYIGTASSTVAIAAAAGATNVTVYRGYGFASNNIVLAQTVGEVVTNLTVWGRTPATNATLLLDNPLGTNLAVGDLIRKRGATAYTIQAHAGATDTVYFVNSTNGIAANDVLVAELPSLCYTGSISALQNVTNYSVPLRGAAQSIVGTTRTVYERLTNYAALLADSGDGVTLHVATTNGFGVGSNVVVLTAGGDVKVDVVDSISTTNMVLAGGISFRLSAGDRVWLLAANTALVRFPVAVGDRAVVVSTTNGFATDDILVFSPATGAPWLDRVGGAATPTAVANVTLAAPFGGALPVGTRLYKLTNSHPVVIAADRTSVSVTTANATNLTAGDVLIITPATGGAFKNVFRASATTLLDRINFTGANLLPLAVGDHLFLRGETNSIPVGATTLRQQGSIFTLPAGRPAQLILSGTSSCAINQVIVDYGR